QVIAYARRRYRILGETLDVALGNCIDRLARLLQVGPAPAPPRWTRPDGHAHADPAPFLADPQRSQPRLQRGAAGQEAVTPKLLESGEATPEDLCFSLQETAFAALAEVTERALALTRARHLLLVGGVAC
ncbi:OSGEP threonylcarbamoyltransferase, partial [Vidua chalybeata]|nr:OSGEP threonylcarbamoyltransferase [Vidua chalybeata]